MQKKAEEEEKEVGGEGEMQPNRVVLSVKEDRNPSLIVHSKSTNLSSTPHACVLGNFYCITPARNLLSTFTFVVIVETD